MICFACMPSIKANHERRARCVKRGHHRPAGPLVAHEHAPLELRACRDCQTLVVDLEAPRV